MLLSPRDGGSGKRAKVQKRGFTFLCHRQRFSSRSTYMLFMRYGDCGAFINTPARNFPIHPGKGDSNKDLLRHEPHRSIAILTGAGEEGKKAIIVGQSPTALPRLPLARSGD